jgi:type IV pilus assembly protein PilC
MPQYSYRFVDASGNQRSARGEFPSESAVKSELAAAGGTILDIRVEKTHGYSRLSAKALQSFTEMIGMLLSSGHTLSHALELYGELPVRGKSGRTAKAFSRILLNEISKGNSFAQALSSASSSIPDVYLGLVGVGERSGNLPPIMNELNAWLKSSQVLWTKILTAALYPLLILMSLSAVMSFFVFFLLPDFIQTIGAINNEAARQLGQTATALSIGTSLMLVAIMLIPVIAWIYRRSRQSASALASSLERFAIRIPVFGRLIILREMVSLQFAMKTLTAGGVPLEEAVRIAEQSVSLLIFKNALANIHGYLVAGDSLSAGFRKTSELPQEMASWARIGEETGDVNQIFSQLKNYYQQELDVLIQRVSDLIFPVLIIIVGIILLFVVTNVILPILNSLYSSTGL